MTGFWSWVSTCCVSLLVVAIALDPGFAPSQQAKPTEARVDQAIQNCSSATQNDENITSGLKLLRKRMLAEKGVFPLGDIPEVVGVGLKADTTKIPIFDKIQKCAADKLSGRVLTYSATIWLGSKFVDRGDFGTLNSRSTFLITIDDRQIMALDLSKSPGGPSLELTEGEHSFAFSGELQNSEDGAQILRSTCAGKFQMKKSAVLVPHVKLEKAKGVFSDCAIRVE
jgi:hypothetical protein